MPIDEITDHVVETYSRTTPAQFPFFFFSRVPFLMRNSKSLAKKQNIVPVDSVVRYPPPYKSFNRPFSRLFSVLLR